jgi:hypothetical protein
MTVALGTHLTVDDLGEASRQAERLPGFAVLDEDTMKGWGISDERTHWTYYVKAQDEDSARAEALRIASDLFTGVDPEAEVVGITSTGES